MHKIALTSYTAAHTATASIRFKAQSTNMSTALKAKHQTTRERNAHLPVNRESKRGVAAHARLSLTQAVKTENAPASGNDSDRSFSHGVGMKQTCWHNMSNSSSSGNNNYKTIISCISMGALGVADGAQQNLQHAQARAGRTAKPNPSRHPRHRRAGL